MNKISGVIFDFDGTLADTLPMVIAAFKQGLQPLLRRFPTEEEIVATFGATEEGTVKKLLPDQYEQGVSNYYRFYKELHKMCPAPFPGIIELLEALKSREIPMAIVTGRGSVSAKISLTYFKIDSFFELVECGSPDGNIKEEGMKRVLRKWEAIPKEEIVYIGDSPSDVTNSRRVGIVPIAAAWASTTTHPEKLEALGPAAIFYKVSDFAAWLLEKTSKV